MHRFQASSESASGTRHHRRSAFSILALRQRSDNHPMAMFFIIVAIAIAAAALISQSGSAFASSECAAWSPRPPGRRDRPPLEPKSPATGRHGAPKAKPASR